MSERRHRARDEVLELPEGMRQEFTALGMFRWHLERAVFWAARMRWDAGVVRAEVRRLLTEHAIPEPARGATRRITVMQRARVLARDGLRCRRCSSTERLHIDHVKPVALGGSNDIDNLQTLCEGCNCSKRDRLETA